MAFSPSRRRAHRLITFVLSMNLVLALVLELCVLSANAAGKQPANDIIYEENEFAEFEEFDEEEAAAKLPSQSAGGGPPNQRPESVKAAKEDIAVDDDADSLVEDDEDEDIFENVKDDDAGERADNEKSSGKKGDLKFTKVPMHLRSNWESYYMEILMAAGIVVYFINFITGRSKNQRLSNAWLDANCDLLDANFALVGDDGKKEIENHGLIKETENIFSLWCSGRVNVEGMLIELRLLKRQDLVNTIQRLFKPAVDQIVS